MSRVNSRRGGEEVEEGESVRRGLEEGEESCSKGEEVDEGGDGVGEV